MKKPRLLFVILVVVLTSTTMLRVYDNVFAHNWIGKDFNVRRWGNFVSGSLNITYRNLANPVYDSVISKEISDWNTVTPINIYPTNVGTGQITFSSNSYGTGQNSFVAQTDDNDPRNGIFTHIDIRLNDDYLLYGQGYSSTAGRQHALCHELGHALGLGHEEGGSTCMMTSLDPNRPVPDFTQHERDFLSSKYPQTGCIPGSYQIAIYMDANQQGVCSILGVGEFANYGLIEIPNDSLSSIRLGRSVEADLCRDDNFLGVCETLVADDPDLGNNNIGSDQTSSIRVRVKSNSCPQSGGVIVYWNKLYNCVNDSNDPGFRQRTITGFQNIDDVIFNDKVSSIKIPAGWSVRLYEHENRNSSRSGGSVCRTSDDSDFEGDTYTNGTGLNDSVSSIEVFSNNRCDPNTPTPTSPPPPPPSGWNETFFSTTDLNSQCGTRNENDIYMFRDSDAGWQPPSGCPSFSNPWSVRMERGDAYFAGGNYEFGMFYDDAARLYVDGQLVVDGWNAQQHYESRYLTPGHHRLVLEYKNNAGHAIIQLWWRGPGAIPPNVQTKDPNQWWTIYWGNQTQWPDPVAYLNEGGGFLNKQWDDGGPGFGIYPEHFSARFERAVHFACGTYSFHLISDDGSRLFVDGNLIPSFNHWETNTWDTTDNIQLQEGEHEIRVDYFENGGNARVALDWSPVSTCLTPPPPSCPTITGWKGLYWNNKSLSGQYSLCRNDPNINFTEWGAGSPDPVIQNNQFSVRWSKVIDFSAGRYRFDVFHDDGFVFYLNGVPQFQHICDGCSEWDYYSTTLGSGPQEVVLEYWENIGSAAVIFRYTRLDPPLGDANADGKVDILDYSILFYYFSQRTNQGSAHGDFNMDGIVDGIDYVIFLNNFGKY